MKTTEIRKLFLDYYKGKDHQIVDSSGILPYNDETLLFTNSGMVQFKNVFTGIESRSYKRAATVQKCLRAGGKHNDLDNVGYTARHHTFFEMLGNFSFGDYFKEQAIFYAWDFLTNSLGLSKERLLVTVYYNDYEAIELWKKIANLPEDRIIKINTSDNFWEMGDLGPCGPCTEIFYDRGDDVLGGPPGSENEDGDRYVEIWNLVFMQYEKLQNGDLIALKKPCIDTGMGLERIASIMQGKKDNYDIDLFQNIMKDIALLSKQEITISNKTSFKVIADHLRAICFMIVDGIIPSNEGRGYVLRRILRRAIRYAYILGVKDPILYRLVDTVKREMGGSYPELGLREAFIKETIEQEEVKFGETFENGFKILNQEMDKLKNGEVFSGSIAFRLYDTYGFPVDLTEDILRYKGILLDKDGFEEAFNNHKNLAKNSWRGSGEAKDDPLWFALSERFLRTEFVGYNELEKHGKIIALISNITNSSTNEETSRSGHKLNLLDKEDSLLSKRLIQVSSLSEGEEGFLLVERTPFYAELGGQVADKGIIKKIDSKGIHGDSLIQVLDVQKRQGDLFYHKIRVEKGIFSIDDQVNLIVDRSLRRSTQRNHSAIHLLYGALKKSLGEGITQQGSMVNEERLRLDVSLNRGLRDEEIRELEDIVNEMILDNHPVIIEDMKLEEAIKRGAIPLFAEKYPEVARTVRMGDSDSILNDFELCGGTHVKSTGEIGLFKIVSEGSIASGVRRLEGVCGKNAILLTNDFQRVAKSLSKILSIEVSGIENKVSSLLTDNIRLKKSHDVIFSRYQVEILRKSVETVGEINCIFEVVDNLEASRLRDISNSLIAELPKLFCILLVKNMDKVSFFIGTNKEIAERIDFPNFTKEFLAELDATGGGSKLFIQGVGKFCNVNKTRNFVFKKLAGIK